MKKIIAILGAILIGMASIAWAGTSVSGGGGSGSFSITGSVADGDTIVADGTSGTTGKSGGQPVGGFSGATIGKALKKVDASNVGDADGASLPPVTTIVSSGNITVTSPNAYVICTNTCSVTPYAVAAGNQLCVRNAPGSATAITLVNQGTGKYYELTDHSAWATANQKLVSAAGATAAICIVGYDATHYATMNNTLTWTDTAP